MLADCWKRPSIVLGLWTGGLLLVFVLRGDLHVDRDAPATGSVSATPASGRTAPQPVVIHSQAPVPATTIARTGRVYDAMGFLLVGAEVQLPDGRIERTDADGAFHVEVPSATGTAPGSADLLVRAAGHHGEWLRAPAVSPDPLLVQLAPAAPWDRDLAPLPAPATGPRGEGLVRGPDGAPLANAFVTQVASDRWARTDAFGRYALQLAVADVAAPVTLLVHEPDGGGGRGAAWRSEPITLPRATGAVPLPDAVAEPAAAIRGTVRDERGNPVAGVPIELRAGDFVRVTESGSNGMFRVGGLLPARYTVRPFAHRGSFGAACEVAAAGPMADCELALQSAADRRLRVVDEAGKPVALVWLATALDGRRCNVDRTDAEGWATVRAPAAATFEVRAGEGYRALPVRRFDAERSVLWVGE